MTRDKWFDLGAVISGGACLAVAVWAMPHLALWSVGAFLLGFGVRKRL